MPRSLKKKKGLSSIMLAKLACYAPITAQNFWKLCLNYALNYDPPFKIVLHGLKGK